MWFFRYVETLVEVLSRPKIVSIKSSRGENLESGGKFYDYCPYCRYNEHYKVYENN